MISLSFHKCESSVLMKVILRHINESDAEELSLLANNVKIRDGLRTGFPHPYTIEDAHTFIKICGEAKHLSRAIEVDGVYAGQIGIHPGEKSDMEIGYWIGEEFWGRGIVSEAIKLVIPLAKEILMPTSIFAKVIKDNIGSWKALEKNGFIYQREIDERCNEQQTSATLLYILSLV